MKKFTIINLSGFTPTDELAIIEKYGFSIRNYSLEEVIGSRLPEMKAREPEISGLLRSERLEQEQYGKVYTALLKHGIRLRNTPEISAFFSEFALHYPHIAEMSPRALIFPSNASAQEIVEQVKTSGLGSRLFIKTEKKSLKAESMIQEITYETVDRCLKALTKAFAPFKNYVVKEIIPLESTDHRAIIFGTHIIGFDTGPYVGDKNAMTSMAFEFVYNCVGILARKGIVGNYVMDVAKRTDTGDFKIVEIKDLQFTQIKHPEFIWGQFAHHSLLE